MAWTAISFLAFLVGFAVASETLPAPPSFTWNFSSDNDTESLLACGTYGVLTTENALTDGGQFNLRAFSPNVTSIYMDVGGNASSLRWQVPFPSDFQVMLGMVDSSGQSAEVKGPYSINGSVQCTSVNVSAVPSFKVTTNVTTPKSCDPVEIFISGGTPPYNATIVIEGVGVISRALTGKDDIYNWYNVTPSGRRIIFSAQDRDGKLAASSRIITSAGDSNSCRWSSFSSKYRKPWSTVRQVFFGFAITLPGSLVGLFIAGYILFRIIRLLYQVMVLVFYKLRRMVRCGDEEFGSQTDGDVPDTRPHTPVAPPNGEGPSRPGTPTSMNLTTSTVVAPQAVALPQQIPILQTIHATLPVVDGDQKGELQEEKYGLDEKI